MKKIDIINEYNSLSETLRTELSKYHEYTGQEWEESPNVNNLPSSAISYGKNDLEIALTNRKYVICSIKKKTDAFLNKREMMNDESGKEFIDKLNKRMDDLKSAIENKNKEMIRCFNDLLHNVGLDDWNINGDDMIDTGRRLYFEICHSSSVYTSVNIEIRYDTKWRMLLNCATRGSSPIEDIDPQYLWFEAYLVIKDNHELFQEWMDTYYEESSRMIHRLTDKLKECRDMMEDPYRYWKK